MSNPGQPPFAAVTLSCQLLPAVANQARFEVRRLLETVLEISQRPVMTEFSETTKL
jgi:hypothetical protein